VRNLKAQGRDMRREREDKRSVKRRGVKGQRYERSSRREDRDREDVNDSEEGEKW
jgi:hypothetical protein